MPFCRITLCLTVEESACDRVTEKMHNCLDNLALERIAVFESEISATTVCEAEDVDEVRREIAQA